MAQTGKSVYASQCARCHGTEGKGAMGPALIGPNASLSKYNTGKGLLDYIAKSMPQTAPGSLSHQEYLGIVSFLLVSNSYISADTGFEESALSGLQIK